MSRNGLRFSSGFDGLHQHGFVGPMPSWNSSHILWWSSTGFKQESRWYTAYLSIGFTLRHLVSKCASSFGVSRLADYFSPVQLGVGTAGGCEAAVHATRRYLETMPPGWVLVKLDFSNAFNSLHRSDMLLAIRERLPELYAYCFSAYAKPSILFHGPFTLSSEEGPQQGDPLGPLLFSNCIHPMLKSMESMLKCGYLDDVTLGDPADSIYFY